MNKSLSSQIRRCYGSQIELHGKVDRFLRTVPNQLEQHVDSMFESGKIDGMKFPFKTTEDFNLFDEKLGNDKPFRVKIVSN